MVVALKRQETQEPVLNNLPTMYHFIERRVEMLRKVKATVPYFNKEIGD